MTRLHLFELLVIREVPHVMVVHAHIVWVLSHLRTVIGTVTDGCLRSNHTLLVPLGRLQQHIDELLSHILVEPLIEEHLLELILLL